MDFIHHTSLPFWSLMFLKEKYPLKDMDHQTLTVYSTVYEFANFLKRKEIEDPCTDDITEFIKKYPPINMWWYENAAPALIQFLEYCEDKDYELYLKDEKARAEGKR